MHKKLISSALTFAILVNSMPMNLVQSFADEVTGESLVVEETIKQEIKDEELGEEKQEEIKQEEIKQENDEEQIEDVQQQSIQLPSTEEVEESAPVTKGIAMTRTATANVSIENGEYGRVTGLNSDNKVILKSEYENVTSSTFLGTTTYKGTLLEHDSSKQIVITPREGYEFDDVSYGALLGLDLITDFISVSKNGDIVTINVSALTSGSWIKNKLGDNTNKSETIKVKFVKKSNAKQITTEVQGEGAIELDPSEDLVQENGAYTIAEGSKHTFNIVPVEGMEVKSVTLNDEPVSVVDGKVTVGAGHLKAVFGEPAEETHNLEVSITGKGKVVIANQELDKTGDIKLNQGESYNFALSPAEGYYVSSVKLDGNEVTDYKIENVNGAHKLEVEFKEKLDTTIKLGDLKVKWDGKEKFLPYEVVASDGTVVKEGNVEFKKTNIFGQEIVFNPKDANTYKFYVDYAGDDKYNSSTISGQYEIYDARKDVTIEFENLSKVYNGEVQYPDVIVRDIETNEVIENADVNFKYDFIIDITKTRGKDVGSYNFEATFNGNEDYRQVSQNGTFEVTKVKPKVSVGNIQVKYDGKPVAVPVTISPDCGYLTVYAGVNVTLSPNIFLDVNLGDDPIGKLIKSILNSVNLGNVGDLVNLLENNRGALAALGVDVDQILQVLKVVPADMGLSFGCPDKPGAYIASAIALDRNAETAVGIGSLLMIRQDKKVVFSDDSLANGYYLKYGTDYKHEAYYEGTTSKAKIMYSGITAKGEAYFSATKPTELGSYIAIAYSYADLEYQVALAARTFTIGRYLSNLDITSGNKTYDGKPYEPTSVVKDKQGNIIENAYVEYTYYKGSKKLECAPKDAGVYLVKAKYNCTDDYFLSTDSKIIEIKKANLTITANDAEKYEGQVDPEFTYTAQGLGVGDTLDVTFKRVTGEKVGEYKITPSCSKNSNYKMTFKSGKLTIKEMTYEIDLNVKDKIYDGKIAEVNAEVVDAVGNKVENAEVKYTYYKGEEKLNEAPINAGNYKIEAEYKGTKVSKNYEIKKALTTITVNNASKYEGEKDPKFTYKVEGLVGNDTIEDIVLSREDGEKAGEYNIIASHKSHSNYNVTVANGKLTIKEMTYEIALNIENKVYDGKAANVSAEVVDVLGNKVEKPDIKFTYYEGEEKLTESPVNAGNYKVEAEYKGAKVSKNFEIKKASATIKVNDASKYEGEKDPQFTYKVEGLIAKDVIENIVLSREEGEKSGEYIISVVHKENPNYKVIVANGKLTIKEMTYEIVLNVENKVYDGKVANVSVEVVDVLGNKVENPEVKYTYYKGEEKLTEAPVNAGNYKVEAEYKGIIVSKNFEIKKASATIKVNDVIKYEGEKDPEFTYKVDGLVGNDTIENIILSRVDGEKVGEYIITASYKENSNYSVKVVDGKLTIIEKAAIPNPDPNPEDPKPNPDGDKDDNKEDGSVNTFDAGISGYLAMGIAAIGGLFISRRKKD